MFVISFTVTMEKLCLSEMKETHLKQEENWLDMVMAIQR